MKYYKLPVCFWCEQGFNALDCEMLKALGDYHAKLKEKGYDTFASDLPKDRLHKKAVLL